MDHSIHDRQCTHTVCTDEGHTQTHMSQCVLMNTLAQKRHTLAPVQAWLALARQETHVALACCRLTRRGGAPSLTAIHKYYKSTLGVNNTTRRRVYMFPFLSVFTSISSSFALSASLFLFLPLFCSFCLSFSLSALNARVPPFVFVALLCVPQR